MHARIPPWMTISPLLRCPACPSKRRSLGVLKRFASLNAGKDAVLWLMIRTALQLRATESTLWRGLLTALPLLHRSQNWLQEPLEKEPTAAEAQRMYELQRTQSYVLESEPLERSRSAALANVPVHLQADLPSLGRAPARLRPPVSSRPSAKPSVPTFEVEEDEVPCETSPERIRNPRDRPRRRDIKRSTRRSLMGAFRDAGVSGGSSSILGRSHAPERSRSGRFFDWDAFFGSRSGVFAETSGAVFRTTSTRSDDSFSDSSLASSASGAESNIGSVLQPNDSCIDFHQDVSSEMGPSPTMRVPLIPLTNVLATRGCGLTTTEVGVIARALISSLFNLHCKGFVHRNVTPDTILVDDLFDIQSAQLQQAATIVSLGDSIRCNDRPGITPLGFAAPEIARGFKGKVPYSTASDMWSLGATILAITMPHGGDRPGPFGTGSIVQDRRCPPEGVTTDDFQEWTQTKLWNFMNCIVPSADSFEPAPLDIQALVMMLMRVDPAQRAASAYLDNSPWMASFGQQQPAAPEPPVETTIGTLPDTPDSRLSVQSGNTPPSVLRSRHASRLPLSRTSSNILSDFSDDTPPRQRPRLQPFAIQAAPLVGSVRTSATAVETCRVSVHTDRKAPEPGVWASLCEFFCGARK